MRPLRYRTSLTRPLDLLGKVRVLPDRISECTLDRMPEHLPNSSRVCARKNKVFAIVVVRMTAVLPDRTQNICQSDFMLHL